MQDLMPPVNTPDKLFHDGDPIQGIEGTIVPAEWLNNDQSAVRDVQAELINVLAAAALTPDPTKQDQLVKAIQAIVGSGTADKANSADRLSTARNIAGHPFDGTADISIAAGDVDAVSKSGDTMSGVLKVGAEIQTTSSNSYRMISGNYGVFWRQDGTALYLMLTNAGDQYGAYNDFRPLIVDLRTGIVTFPNDTSVNGLLYANEFKAGNARFTNDGNVFGSMWGNDWLSNWINRNLAVKNSLYASTNGWFKDNSSGFIIQWGNRGSTGTGVEAASFNFAFPNNCLAVVGAVGVAINNGNTIYTGLANNQGFNYKASASSMGFQFIAVGY